MSDIDLLTDARAWLATQGDRIQTHSELCHRWHPACLVSRLLSRSGQTEAKARDFGDDVPERDNAGDAPEAHATQGEGRSQGGCTLTAEEREAICEAADAYADNDDDADCERIAHTLRGLLARTSDGRNRQ